MSENKTYRLADNAALAQARQVRMAPMKTRRMVDLVRGMKASEALDSLRFAPQAAAEPVAKVIASAMANAAHNKQLNPDSLWICQAYVDEGPTLKRFRPRAQGRAYRIRKRTSHITIVVETREVVAQKQRPSRKLAAVSSRLRPSAKQEAPAGAKATTKPTESKPAADKTPADKPTTKASAKAKASESTATAKANQATASTKEGAK